jgi:hypothetical protein
VADGILREARGAHALVVDDNSQDRTAAVVAGIAHARAALRLPVADATRGSFAESPESR